MHDFLVIGGGIAGISAAARLAELGSVLVLEAEDHLAHHASGRSAALFVRDYGAPAVVALNEASFDFLSTDEGGVLSPRGVMLVARAEAADAFRAEADQMRAEPLTSAEALARVPVLDPAALGFAAFSPAALDLDTDLLIQRFARAARRNGGIVTRARVRALRRTAAGWAAETAAGSFEGRVVVNAAGAWADEVARLGGARPLGLTPMRRSMARLPAPGGHDVSAWPCLFAAGESWYAKPDAGALIVSPAEEHPMAPHDAWADDMVLAEGLGRYEAMVTEPVTRLIAAWAGLRTFAPDRVLAIGPDPAVRDFFWVAGQGGYGFQTSPAASRLAADLVGGRPSALAPAVVAALSPARFA
jgi:glycine/D-amino acid oxidase-like deaminating enzyme